MARRIPASTWLKYQKLRDAGMSRRNAAYEAGISYGSARDFDQGNIRTTEAQHVVDVGELVESLDGGPVPPLSRDQLSPVDEEALFDFDLFRRRFFGRDRKPWQTEAANMVVELEATDWREWVVVNVPPGAGKSTTFTHDIPAWLIARGRVLSRVPRCLFGSRTGNQAKMYGRRLRSTFMRKRPTEGAEAVLIDAYGSFQPARQDLWRANEFVVWENPEEQPSDEKEPTVACVGMDTGFLGGRYDFVIWDDLVDKSTLRTEEGRKNQQDWFDDEAETRLEPGGLFMLMGQRLSPEDLYRYALNKPAVDDDGELLEGQSKYKHVVFPAHADTQCEEEHGRDARAWPDGCLLDPVRLPWRELMAIKQSDPRKFQIVMQQEDVDPAGVLVPEVFIVGGEWQGRRLPGCLDQQRSLTQLEASWHDRMVSVVSADPSPTKFWSIQWWIYDPDTQLRHLMDLKRDAMDAPDFLDRLADGRYVGVLHDWVVRSQDLGMPITTAIVEQNAAQRFLLQYDHVLQWMATYGVAVIPHNTGHTNKASAEFGVQTLRPQYMYGRIRIPYGDPFTKATVDDLINEVKVWPYGSYDDCVMAQWMFEWNLPNLEADKAQIPTRKVPSWVSPPSTTSSRSTADARALAQRS